MLKAYDFAVGHIGLDVASGPIWAEYIEFTQSNYYKLVKKQMINYLTIFMILFRLDLFL